ncbi:DUF748 domain-containing protein [Roseateles albus]|uniref:DUF748 domain-containing protein n=1 Tax=Roseateles albus TaxID=2987525 RepID=A0ABT5KBY9_9BURK|nr:DUF748 domain-containing protein [Roseateles albus]MDC8771398.1 DUF748 domain-containing protein [Roseateles albus]
MQSWKPWQRLLVGLFGALSGLLLLLFFASWLVLPNWLKTSGAELASKTLGREVSVRAVSFHPWALALTLDGVSVAGTAQQKEALLELEQLTVNLSSSSLWLRSPVIESLTVVRPVLRLTRLSAGHYDIDDLIERFAKPAAPAAPDAKPFALALYNIELRDGAVSLDDKPMARRHEIDHLLLQLPFVSTLVADVKVHVQPQIAGRLNGVAFGAKGSALPFAEQRVATLDFKLDSLDLAPYASYVPAAAPLRLKQGKLATNLQLKFQQNAGALPALALAGQINLSQFALQTPTSAPSLSWRELELHLLDVQPLQRIIGLGAVKWVAPSLSVSKDARGKLHLAGMGLGGGPTQGQETAQEMDPKKQVQAEKAAPWLLSLNQFELSAGGLDWQDASTKPAVSLLLRDIDFKLGALAWPLKAATPINLAFRVRPADGPATLSAASLDGAGSLSAESIGFDWHWQGFDLQWLTPYLQAQLPGQGSLRVAGSMAGKGGLLVQQPLMPKAEQRAKATLADLQLSGLSIGAKSTRDPLLRLGAVDLDQLSVDTEARKISGGELKFSRPALALARSQDGRWNYQDFLPPAKTSPADSPRAKEPALAWSLFLKGLKLDQGSLQLQDAGTRTASSAVRGAPSAVKLEQIKLDMRNFAWPDQTKAMPVNLSLKLAPTKRGSAPSGQLQWQGEASLAPLMAAGSLRLERMPLQLLDPYLDPALGLHLQKGELGLRAQFKARQTAAGLDGQATGKLLLADLLLHQAREVDGQDVVGEELLSWQAMNLDGIKLLLKAGSPPQLSVADVSLNDFFARVIINEQGKVNLRDVGQVERKPAGPAVAEAAASAPDLAASAAPRMPISIGQIRVSKGRLDFNDRFVRPNYSAQLSELHGSLGAFGSERAELAPLSLRGRVAGTGLLDVVGDVNPLGKPLLLDIKATASDIELAPLSPYAAKYVGYAIERGKFSTKVQYKIDAGGALQANNQIILNQLTFGERVESPDATKLPVLFAVALLKDKNGVIDVEVPIKGSINEPEFSVGGVIWKVIGNLLGKALSAPFSLFSGSGDADLSRLEFAPGSAQPLAPAHLDSVAKMMEERPGLSLTIKAWADPVAERAALQERQLEAALLAEFKREQQRDLQRQSSSPAQPSPAEARLSDADRSRLLKPVYQAAKLPNKPKNMIGFAKDIAPEEMRALLLSNYAVSETSVRALALERGVLVRDALIAKGLANSRIFLGAPSLHEPEAGAQEAWKPFADLQLSAH